jgi:hypothetical protein
MASCPNYEVPFASQLRQGGATGPVDCMAWAASRAIGHATCGQKVPSGRTIRLLSNEPVPDPMSPGLRLQQVADVAREDFGVYFEVHGTTYSQVSWAHYERQRLAGRGCVLALGYAPIANSMYDAGRGFDDNHAIFESLHATVDSLADGRAAGVWQYDGRVYPRALIRDAAGELRINSSTTVKDGYVWAAFTRDVVPDFRAVVPAGEFNLYTVAGGVITDRDRQRTGGFSAPCSPPKLYKDAAGLPGDQYKLSRLQSGSRAGYYVPSQYVKEV